MNDTTYLVYESALARMERQAKRLFILCIIIFSALILTNAGWIIYENQYVDSVTETIEATTENGNAYGTITGENSEVNYGESESNKN